MRKNCFSLLGIVLVVLLFMSACVKEETETIEQGVPAPVIYASQENTPDTRSSITVNSEGVGKILWSPADEISVFYGASTGVLYTSTNTEPAAEAAFTTTAIIGSNEGASSNIWGLYPYNSSAVCDGSSVTTSLSATQYGVPGTFDDDLFVTIAHSTSTNLHFFNVCGGIKFSLSRDDISSITFAGNNNEDLAGDISVSFADDLPSVSVINGQKTITLTPKDGGTFAKDTYYYFVVIPQTLSDGFTMTFETDTQIGTFVYNTKSVNLKRSVFGKKDDIDEYASFNSKPTLTNLSASGTANCYIVSSAGNYKFNASVKGNSNESVGTPVSAEVLWESFGTNVTPSVGDLVYSVSLQDGFVYFSATDKKGNALIAVKDSEGTILWSWHIWKTESPVEQEYYNSAGIMMDRNLGATSAVPGDIKTFGVLYQWGRKDPFLGSSSTSSYVGAKSTGTINNVRCTAENGTIEYSIKHPNTFIRGHADDENWIYDYSWLWGDYGTGLSAELWTDEKTIYDPCPPGWVVPHSSVWSDILGVEAINDIPWDGINSGIEMGNTSSYPLGNYSSIWYPCVGYMGSSGTMYSVGKRAHYWSTDYTWNGSSTTWGNPTRFLINYDYVKSVVVSHTATFVSNGSSVRCLKK